MNNAMTLICKAAVVLFFASAFLYVPVRGDASDITTITFRQVNRDIIVNASLQFDQKIIDDLNAGLSKEIIYTVDLIRNRNLLPNEPIKGTVVVKSLYSNPIKREYVGTVLWDQRKTDKRFKDISSMIAWGGDLQVSLADIDMDNESEYFIRVSAESRIFALPSVVDLLFFFLPKTELSSVKETNLFRLNTQQGAK